MGTFDGHFPMTDKTPKMSKFTFYPQKKQYNLRQWIEDLRFIHNKDIAIRYKTTNGSYFWSFPDVYDPTQEEKTFLYPFVDWSYLRYPTYITSNSDSTNVNLAESIELGAVNVAQIGDS